MVEIKNLKAQEIFIKKTKTIKIENGNLYEIEEGEVGDDFNNSAVNSAVNSAEKLEKFNLIKIKREFLNELLKDDFINENLINKNNLINKTINTNHCVRKNIKTIAKNNYFYYSKNNHFLMFFNGKFINKFTFINLLTIFNNFVIFINENDYFCFAEILFNKINISNLNIKKTSTNYFVSFSQKGKQICILNDENLILLTKNEIKNQSKISNLLQEIDHLIWIDNQTFLIITSSFINNERLSKLIIITKDEQIELEEPCFLLENGIYSTCSIQQWGIYKHLIFYSNTKSTDIGIVGCYEQNNKLIWDLVLFPELYSPSLPLSIDKSRDAVCVDMFIDFTNVLSEDEQITPYLFLLTDENVLICYRLTDTNNEHPKSMIPFQDLTEEIKLNDLGIFILI